MKNGGISEQITEAGNKVKNKGDSKPARVNPLRNAKSSYK